MCVAVIHLNQWLEARSSGTATEDEVRIISAHAAHCAACQSVLANDAEIRGRLALLRVGEPRIDVLARVMQRIDDEAEIDPN
jgi:hypothetical protein